MCRDPRALLCSVFNFTFYFSIFLFTVWISFLIACVSPHSQHWTLNLDLLRFLVMSIQSSLSSLCFWLIFSFLACFSGLKRGSCWIVSCGVWRPPFCWTACKRRMLSESESGLAALRLSASSRGMTALWCSLCLSFLLPLCVTPARLPTALPTGRKQYQTLAYLDCSKPYSTVHAAAVKTPVIVLKEIQNLDHRHQKNPTCVKATF